jgi:hypothetical protein
MIRRDYVQKQIISKRGVKDNGLVSIGMSSYGYIENVLFWNFRDIHGSGAKIISVIAYTV